MTKYVKTFGNMLWGFFFLECFDYWPDKNANIHVDRKEQTIMAHSRKNVFAKTESFFIHAEMKTKLLIKSTLRS